MSHATAVGYKALLDIGAQVRPTRRRDGSKGITADYPAIYDIDPKLVHRAASLEADAKGEPVDTFDEYLARLDHPYWQPWLEKWGYR